VNVPELENHLRHLPHAEDAPFNSFAKQHEPTCLADTRVDLLRDIHSWAEGQDERCIFWLSGLAGTGKSTIARTVARSYHDKQRLAASFFFSRGGGEVGHARRFVTSITVQLAHNVPASRQHICDAIAGRSDIASQSLRDQWHHLVLRPLLKLDNHDCPASFVLVVDALDECDDDNNIRIIVQLLAEARSLARVRLRVLLTSRPEVPIRHGFYEVPDAGHQDFVLHNISPPIVDHDITLFLEYNLHLIARERCLRAGWPGAEIIVQLVQNASGLFIWAATACRFIREGKRFAAKRLEAILGNNGAISAAPEKHLNKIYTTVLNNSIYQDYTDEEKEEQCRTIKRMLGSIVVLFSPLSAQSLDCLLDVEEGIGQTLEDLHAILDVPNDQSQPLRLHHPSFRDFLLDEDRCGDAFWVDEKQTHATLAHNCIQLMSSSLEQDICRVGAPGALAAEVDSYQLEECLPSELQYACRYWTQHLAKSGAPLRDGDQVHDFLKEHFLHWLEALGWMGKLSEGINAISSLESTALVIRSHPQRVKPSTDVHIDKRLSEPVRIHTRHEAVRAVQPVCDGSSSVASVLQWACFCTKWKHSKETFCEPDTGVDEEVTPSGERLGCCDTDARGPFRLGHRGGLLSRWQGGGIGIKRQDGQAMGRRYGRSSADA
jgi:hypothetical protein